MVRGCQKKMVYLKNTGSEVFCEAYFVVRDDALASVDECDMIREANRILNESTSFEETVGRHLLILEFIKRKTVPFLCGIVFGMIIVILTN